MLAIKPRFIEFRDTASIPNNPSLPVLIYEAAVEVTDDLAGTIETIFERNDWPPQWRNGIYDYDHYHSTAHEALGIAGGEAVVILGGSNGEEVSLFPGDVVVLPAGTGHRRIRASSDFLVVGAYPAGQNWDIISADEPEKKSTAVRRIAQVPLPLKDPLVGEQGPLMHLWTAANQR